ncbi:MAG: MFS transporter [Cyanobacteria bacterium P01_H01_bin.121]
MSQTLPLSERLEWLQRLQDWAKGLPSALWVLTLGQLLLFIGQGFTLVYASIYFVNQLGFTATQVGLSLGSASIAGIFGRFAAGNIVDSPRFGRRRTLMLAAGLAAIASLCLALAHTFAFLTLGNMLMGLGLSFYWPATLAVLTDLTEPEQRADAFALTRLADSLGLGIGALLAGQWIAHSGSYPALFLVKAALYLLFLLIIYATIAETRQPQAVVTSVGQSWRQAFGDRRLLLWLTTNLFFTTYVAHLSTILPLYLANFVPGAETSTGFAEQTISYFFFWQILLRTVLQLPLTQVLKRLHFITALIISLGIWSVGFGGLWYLGLAPAGTTIIAILSVSLLAIAEITYLPCAATLVGELAPDHLRGVYFSLESQCWGFGFLVAPTLGGWALDHPQTLGSKLWLGLAASILVGIVLLSRLKRQTPAIARSNLDGAAKIPQNL